MKRRWFSSDFHLGHKNISGFCDRPFVSLDYMNNAIIANINETVPLGDELWVLGDVAMGNLDSTLPLLKRIVADLVIVAGNHDRCHPYYGAKSLGWEARYLEETGAVRLETTNSSVTLSNGITAQVSHFPYGTNDARPLINRNGKVVMADKFAAWRPEDNDGWLLCGHVHEKWMQQGKQINVGVDAWAGFPISEERIVELMAGGPMNRGIAKWVTP